MTKNNLLNCAALITYAPVRLMYLIYFSPMHVYFYFGYIFIARFRNVARLINILPALKKLQVPKMSGALKISRVLNCLAYRIYRAPVLLWERPMYGTILNSSFNLCDGFLQISKFIPKLHLCLYQVVFQNKDF